MRTSSCLSGVLLLLLTTTSHAQVREVKVSAPTRIDWAFAASAFGPEAGKVPAGYDSTKQRYQLAVPKNYKKDRDWPLIVFISPGDGPAGWNNWKIVCEKEGILFCSPFGAGNSCPIGQRCRIVLDMLDDIRQNHRIDPDQTYISGFSGGGRMACSIGYALPEYFGGIAPVCGTNPPPNLTYLRHRALDRLSVAFITGEKDFNRKENEEYMQPFVQEIGIRTRLWVVPQLAHGIPSGNRLQEVYDWLKADLKRRRADRTLNPSLQVESGAPPARAQQARQMLETAASELKQAERVWRGVALLQGVANRFKDTPSAGIARKTLALVQQDEKLLELIEQQGGLEERRYLYAQARGLERFGARAKAEQAWKLLAEHHPQSEEGKKAVAALKRLQN